MRRLVLSLVALVLIAALAALVWHERSSRSAARPRPELQRVLDELVRGRDRIAPGASAYVAGPRGVWQGSAGVANVATGERMKPDARIRLESVSKLWTATVVMRLVAEGRLSLDDTVERWLPGLLPYGKRINVRELLDHTSGMVDTNDVTRDPNGYLRQVRDPALRARVLAVARRLEENPGYEFSPRLWVELAAALPLEFQPGLTYHYSNVGYMVAGLVAERAGGADLKTLTRKEILEPLKLKSAAYDPKAAITGEHAHGYRVAKTGELTDATTWTEGLGANGGIVSDAADEAAFLQAVMRGKLLDRSSLTALKRAPSFSSYALGIGIDHSVCAGAVYGHNGGGEGFETNVFVSGDGSRVAVLLLNGRTADDHGDLVAYEAMRSLYCAA